MPEVTVQPQEFADLVATLRRTAAALASVDPSDVPASLAAQAVTELAAAVALADNAAAVVARRVESSGLWAHDGARSAAAWLASRTGEARGQVHTRLGAARVADEHPAFRPGFRAGEVGVAHLTAVHRLLSGPGGVKERRRVAFPAFEESLAEAARHTDAATFATVLRRWAAAVDHAPEHDEFDAFCSRYLVFTELGSECLIEGRLPLAEGRWLRRLLESLVDAHHRRTGRVRLARRTAGAPAVADPAADPAGSDVEGETADPRDRVPRSALLCDALVELARLADASPDGLPIVDGTPAQVLVVVGLDRLVSRVAQPNAAEAGAADSVGWRRAASGLAPPGNAPPDIAPSGALWGGSVRPISDAQARRHACGDAEIRRLVLDPAGIVTELGRRQRLASRDQRLLVALRDGTCRFPGCHVPAGRCRPHHVVHWADGGTTDVGSLVALCDAHHRFVHEGGVAVTGAADGELAFRRDGRLLGATRPRPAPGQKLLGGA